MSHVSHDSGSSGRSAGVFQLCCYQETSEQEYLIVLVQTRLANVEK